MSRVLHQRTRGGFTFIEVLVAAAVIGLVFSGLLAGVQSSVRTIGNSKAKAGANALLVERMEYIRSLPYRKVGTVGAPPYGDIPQTSTTTLNGVTYTERVLIRYVDDPADGLGYANDENGVIEDYKQVTVTYQWEQHTGTQEVSSVTNVVPVGVESSTGGGSLRVNVFDASAVPLSGVAVTIVNDSLATTTNTTQYTDAGGQLLISGLPAGANYEIWATQSGYSDDGTTAASADNPNPTTPPVAIVESAVSTMHFQIDQLSDLEIDVLQPPTEGVFSDTFADDALVSQYASTTRSGGAIELSESGGVYEELGMVVSTSTTPTLIDSWYAFDFVASTTDATGVRVQLYYDAGAGLALVPDTDLPGNSSGFTAGPVDIRSLDTGVYNTLQLGATLSTDDTSITPLLEEWSLTHIESQTGISGVPVTVTGTKVIGTNASGSPVYKFNESYTSDGNGDISLPGIEYDTYRVTAGGGYDVVEVCPLTPFTLLPAVSETISLTLDTLSGAFARVTTTNSITGDPIAGAVVRLQNGSYDTERPTSICGQTYFNGGGLTADDDYTLSVSADGYEPVVHSSTTVSTATNITISLTPS